MRTRHRWGWGYEDAALGDAELTAMAEHVPALLGMPVGELRHPADAFSLAEAKVAMPPQLAAFSDASHAARARHAYGLSYVDTVRRFRGDYGIAPDFVSLARDERDVEAVLEWAAGAGAAVLPYGGGTSVVGGFEARCDPARPAVCLDVSAMDRVLEVDPVSRAARVQCGPAGPRLEAQLAEHGMTMRFFPQSFELSTLGGWIATRAGGHFATGPTHIDDLVESVRAITPSGTWESRRLPGSGAGPSPDRMLLGSEGTLGVITEAWVRVQPRPPFRSSRGVAFDSFITGADAVRELAQSGLGPSNCRLIDADEARFTGTADSAFLVLGFESTDSPVDALLERGLAICREHGGSARESSSAVGDWREAFIRMPYVRDGLLRLGLMADTFETAITWERFEAFHEQVVGATRAALGEPCRVTCRFTHVYADGPAPYFTVIAPARLGEEEAQWWEMKRAASDAIIAAGGTITHHHAVGRDHRPWYDEQRPDAFAAALRGAKAAVDPAGIMNPGVLLG
jgi:alkyldihydroxyacetonephosphate synthase